MPQDDEPLPEEGTAADEPAETPESGTAETADPTLPDPEEDELIAEFGDEIEIVIPDTDADNADELLLAYLEKTPNDTIGRYPIYNHTFEYPTKSGKIKHYTKVDYKYTSIDVPPIEVFQRSSNVGMASMIFEAYGKRGFPQYMAQLKKMGLLDTIHSQLGDLMPARIRDVANDFNTYYATCFGAGFNIPIIRTLIYYNAIANGGNGNGVYVDDVYVGNESGVGVIEAVVITNGDAVIYDLFGRKVAVAKFREGCLDLDMNRLASGIYIARISNEQGTRTMKIVKE